MILGHSLFDELLVKCYSSYANALVARLSTLSLTSMG